MFAGLGLGIGLLVIGLAFVLLVWVILRMLPGNSPAAQADAALPLYTPDTASTTEAVLIIQPGGRVEYINALARRYFGLGEEEYPDLERLARHVRPSDDFMEVCAAPNQKRLTVNGKLVEAVSYQIPGAYPMVMVVFRGIDLAPALQAQGLDSSSSIIKVITDFSQSITASLDLDETLRAILDNVSRLVASDLLEIKIWDRESQSLVPYRFADPGSMSREVRRAADSQFASFTDSLVAGRQPVFLGEAAQSAPALGDITTIQSYIGIPLLIGNELVGTLEVGQTGGASFGQHDFDLLNLIAGPSGAALRNAALYEEEQRRAAELAGLANLTQAFSLIQDARDLFTRLVESVAPLFDADIIGFLLYDEEKRILQGQVPFHGLPPHIVDIYRASIPPASPAEQLLNSQRPILTLSASQDENWRTLGLTDIAVAASLRDSALIPLASAGHMMGYFQVSHHRQGPSSFTADELRLMNIVANQAAAIIENALLVQQARGRAMRSDALRRIASLAASSATLDEILKFSMQEMAHLFQADIGVIFLLDETRGELRLHRESAWGVSHELAESFARLFVDEAEYRQTVSGSQRSFLSGRLSADRRASSFYRPLVEKSGMESALAVPLVARDRSIGELILASQKYDFFNPYDLQVISTAAGQLASAIESAGLVSQTDESLRRSMDHLISISRIGRELNASLEPDHIVRVIHDECLHAVHADCATVILFEDHGRIANPRIALTYGCSTDHVLSNLERRALEAQQLILIPDFANETEPAPHENVRSAVIAPLAYHENAAGLIHLHSSQPLHFSDEAIHTIETVALQAAIALDNARRYQNERTRAEILRRRAETLSRLSEVGYAINLDQPLEHTLQIIAQGIKETTPFQGILVSIYEPETSMLRRVTGVGIPQDTLNELLARKQLLSSVQQLMKPEFKIGRSYFIPADQTPIIPSDVHMVTLELHASSQKDENAWDPDDFLLIPLEDAQGNPLGLISLDAPANGLRPDRATIDSLDAFASQAALAISNWLRFGELRNRVDALSAGLQRQQKLLSVTQNDVPILLRKDLETTISLHNLERRAQRVRAGLAITESVSRQLDGNSALMALGRETLTQLGMSVALVAENANDGPRLLHVLGSVPRSTNVEALFGQRNPLRACLQTGDPILISSLEEDDEWRDAPLLSALRAKAVICLPVMVENRPIAAMLALSPEPMPPFTDEDRQVYYQISRQTSVILQNISLLNETRRRLQEVNLLLDFSRRLTGLNPQEIIAALLESARRVLQSAHAGAALLWDAQNELLTPQAVSGYADNDSMMRIKYRSGEALPGIVFAQGKPRRVDEINFTRDYTLPADDLLLYRQATGGRLPVSSLLVPIAAGDKPLGLLLLDNFNTPGIFRAEDEALLLSLAQQVALSLENVRLVHDTQERAGQLQALNEVAASLTSNLRSDQLVPSLLDQLAPVLPFDTATLLLRDKEFLKVAAARGFTDSDKRIGLTVAVADSALFNAMSQHGQPIVVGDVREDARFPRTDSPYLSWLGIPMISKDELIGVITLEKEQPHFFTREHVQAAATFASQAAVAIENARLYEDSLSRAAELDQRSRRLALLNRFSTLLSGLLDSEQILQLTSNELQQALNVKRVSIVTFERGQAIWKAAAPRPRYKLPKALPDAPIFARLRESLGIFNTDDAGREPDLQPLMDMIGDSTTSLLIVPMAGGNILRALVFIHAVGDYRFGLNEIDLIRTIANQAAIALENARLYQSTVNTAERFAILNETSSQVSASLDPEQVYVAVHKAAERLMPLDSFAITLLDPEKQEIAPVYLFDLGKRYQAERVPLGRGLSSRIIQTGKPLLISTEEQANQLDTIQAGPGDQTQSILAVPMILGGRALGMLSVQSYQPNVYSEEDLQILGTLANQAIVAIQNGRLFAETQNLAEQLEARVVERTAQLQREQQNTETLLRILTEVSSSLDLDRALNRTLSLLNEALGAEQGTIMLVHAEDNLLHYRAGYGYLSDRGSDGESGRGFTLKIGEGLAGWVVQNREAVLVNDLYEDPRWVRSATNTSQDHRSAMVTPMLVGEDVIGVLMVFHRTPHFFSVEMLNLVKAIAGQVAVAINNAHLYELIRDQAERLGVMLRKEQEDASRSQAILEAVADGVLVTGVNNKIEFVNRSTERILGIDAQKVLGRPLDIFGGLFGRAANDWMETIRVWSENPSAYQTGDSYAEQLELENGRIALVHLAPVILQNDFLGTVSIFRDITHEVEVDRLKSEFVATVSHELRTPMTAIKGYVDILMMGAAGAVTENQQHFLNIVKNNIERLNILVNDLLDISRIEAGRVVLSPQPLDLREVAEDVIADVLRRSREDNKPMALSLDAAKTLPRVRGDAERVRQILGNLVENAYRYTPENGTIQVCIHALNGSEVQVDVADNGVGIPPEDQPRVFERFYRGENPLVLATPGTGLGLSIVQQLVQMHSGKMWLTSKGIPGEGSTFSFTLPVYGNQ